MSNSPLEAQGRPLRYHYLCYEYFQKAVVGFYYNNTYFDIYIVPISVANITTNIIWNFLAGCRCLWGSGGGSAGDELGLLINF